MGILGHLVYFFTLKKIKLTSDAYPATICKKDASVILQGEGDPLW